MEQIVADASNEAQNRGHEYVTLEHLLCVLMKSEQVRQLCPSVGGDLKTLDKDLTEYPTNDDFNGLNLSVNRTSNHNQ